MLLSFYDNDESTLDSAPGQLVSVDCCLKSRTKAAVTEGDVLAGIISSDSGARDDDTLRICWS